MQYPTETKAKLISDYKTGNYSQRQLAKAYSIDKSTVIRWTKNVQKGSLTQEIQDIYDNEHRDKMVKALKDNEIDVHTLAKEYKKILRSGDKSLILKAIIDLNKVYGNYAQVEKASKPAQAAAKASVILNLPHNKRLDNIR